MKLKLSSFLLFITFLTCNHAANSSKVKIILWDVFNLPEAVGPIGQKERSCRLTSVLARDHSDADIIILTSDFAKETCCEGYTVKDSFSNHGWNYYSISKEKGYLENGISIFSKHKLNEKESYTFKTSQTIAKKGAELYKLKIHGKKVNIFTFVFNNKKSWKLDHLEEQSLEMSAFINSTMVDGDTSPALVLGQTQLNLLSKYGAKNSLKLADIMKLEKLVTPEGTQWNVNHILNDLTSMINSLQDKSIEQFTYFVGYLKNRRAPLDTKGHIDFAQTEIPFSYCSQVLLNICCKFKETVNVSPYNPYIVTFDLEQ